MKLRLVVSVITRTTSRRQARSGRVPASLILLLIAVAATLGASGLAAQQSDAKGQSAIPRTAWGDPVFSGVWNYSPDLKTNPGVGSNDIVYGNAADPVHLEMLKRAVANGALGGAPTARGGGAAGGGGA